MKDKDEKDIDMSAEELDDSVISEEGVAATIKKLREKLKALEQEKQEYLSGWQRAKADLVNARKRDEEAMRELAKFANGALIADLIPVLESFELAMADKAAWEKADKNWRMGVEYIYSQLKKTLADKGLIEIDPVGQKFDHALHEAVSYEDVSDEKLAHSVVSVIQRGYSLHGKLLKAAKVRVGELKKASS